MSEVSGKKRKSLSSPNQDSISKFFKSCARSPQKVPVSKADDITRNEDNEEKTKIAVEQKTSKVKEDKLSQFERGNPRKEKEDQQNGKEEEDVAMDTSSSKFFNGKSDVNVKNEKAKSVKSKGDTNAKKDKLKGEKSKKNSSNDKSKINTSSSGELAEESKKVDEVVDRGLLFADIKNLKRKVTFTPLEQQVITIKVKHLDVLLFVECGYRYRFFGEDAEVAAKELDLVPTLDHNFMAASIPVHRLTVHVSRLVEKGYKVGVVKQTETAALKAAGDNKSAPFTRKLSQVYTKATFVDREENEESSSDISSGRYVISICEAEAESKQPYIAMYCVNPTSGDIACLNIDVDENILSKIETIFCAMKPSEVLLSKQIKDKKMEEYIRKHCKRDESRVEQLKPSEDEISITREQLKKKLGADFECDGILKCISIMTTYLKEFELQNLIGSLRNYRLYSLERNCMHIDGSTIKNLELLENTHDRTIKGSLLWIVDHTHTVFGKRLLKTWMLQPLISIKQINKRLDAVSELVEHIDSVSIQEIKKQFQGCLDIEKNITGIFYRKITPAKFIKTMEALAALNSLLTKHADELNQKFTSSLLKSIFDRVPKLLGTDVDDVINSLNKEAAGKGNKENLFLNLKDYPRIGKANAKIKELEKKLEDHKDTDVQQIVGPVEYRTVSGSEYLIEVKNKELSKVPKNWIKVSSTKQVTRYRPPYVEEKFKILCQTREKLKIAADAAWESFLNDFSDMYDFCRKAVLKFAELDCLLSLATVAKQADHCRPVFDNDCDTIEIINGRHPVLSALLPDNKQYVGNDIHLGADMKAMIVSGPNMGGKSSYIRQVAVNCILAQIGSYIPASSARLCALDGVYTRMGSSDDIAKGKSTFMLELEQASMIIREATSKSLVILDELGRGTSTYDGMAIAFATLKFFIENTKAFTLFVTHYPMLSEFEKLYPKNISNHHMAFVSASDGDEKENVPAVESIIFLYKLIKGAAKKSYGLNVARLAGIPYKILTTASSKSSQMENEVQQRMDNVETLKSLFCSKNSVAALKELVINK